MKSKKHKTKSLSDYFEDIETPGPIKTPEPTPTPTPCGNEDTYLNTEKYDN